MGSTEVRFPGLGITFNVNDVAFSIGSFEIKWYGVIIGLGVALCFALAIYQARKNKFSSDLVSDILLVCLPSAIIGARLYYVLCNWDYYSADWKLVVNTRAGGLAVYGGIIGALLALLIMCRIRKISFAACTDYCIPYLALGQAIGRWGNFFNQEAFGTTTTLPWGMTSDEISSYLARYCPQLDPTMPVHPTFLYESICNIILFFILLKVRKNSKHSFETTSVYLIVYGAARYFIEGLRTDSLYIGSTGIRTSQLLSVILVLLGLLWIAFARTKDIMRKPLPEKFILKEESKFIDASGDSEAEKNAEKVSDEEVSDEEVSDDEISNEEVSASEVTDKEDDKSENT